MPTDSPSAFPKLVRSINILVAGHPEARLEGHGAAAQDRLAQVLEQFAQYRDAGQADALFAAPLYAHGACAVRLITGNCDGVDAWARELGARLALQVSVIDGAAPGAEGIAAGAIHFGCPAETLEHDDSVHALRDEFALLHADLLLAVWDGKAARGHLGGVVRMIQHAVQVGVPVLWIDLQGQLRELDYTRVDDTTRFQLAHVDFRAVAADAIGAFGPAVDDPVVPSLRRWLDPLHAASQESDTIVPSLWHWLNPLHAAGQESDTKEAAMLRLYANETAGWFLTERFVGLADRFFSAVCAWSWRRLINAFRSPHLKSDTGFPEMATLPPAIEERLKWSDVRANIAAGKHRGGVWLMHLLASMAVFAAIAGSLYLGVEHEGWSSLFWPACEALLLVLVLSMLGRTYLKKWHARWLGQRQITEQLRFMCMTRPMLGLTAFFSLPPLRYDRNKKKVRLMHPEAWLVRRTLTSEGLSHGENGYALHGSTDEARTVGLQLIQGQIDFHHSTAARLKTIHRTMHTVALVLFCMSLVSVAAHLLLPIYGAHPPAYLLFATAFFPALAAALHGIGTKLEVARLEKQSHTTHERLSALKPIIEEYANVPHADPWQQTLYLRSAILSAAGIMSDEAQSWSALIAQQGAGLPA